VNFKATQNELVGLGCFQAYTSKICYYFCKKSDKKTYMFVVMYFLGF